MRSIKLKQVTALSDDPKWSILLRFRLHKQNMPLIWMLLHIKQQVCLNQALVQLPLRAFTEQFYLGRCKPTVWPKSTDPRQRESSECTLTVARMQFIPESAQLQEMNQICCVFWVACFFLLFFLRCVLNWCVRWNRAAVLQYEYNVFRISGSKGKKEKNKESWIQFTECFNSFYPPVDLLNASAIST